MEKRETLLGNAHPSFFSSSYYWFRNLPLHPTNWIVGIIQKEDD
jgi:hypothetical protein